MEMSASQEEYPPHEPTTSENWQIPWPASKLPENLSLEVLFSAVLYSSPHWLQWPCLMLYDVFLNIYIFSMQLNFIIFIFLFSDTTFCSYFRQMGLFTSPKDWHSRRRDIRYCNQVGIRKKTMPLGGLSGSIVVRSGRWNNWSKHGEHGYMWCVGLAVVFHRPSSQKWRH